MIVVITAIYTLLEKPETRRTYGATIWWWLAVFSLAVFMTGRGSKFIWDHIGVLRDFQFPWRWLALVSLSVSILSGVLVVYRKSIRRFSAPAVLSIILVGATLVLNSSYALPEYTLPPLPDADYRPFRERETEIRNILETDQLNTQVYFFSEIPSIFSKAVSVDRLHELMSQALADYKKAVLMQADASIKFPEKLEIVSGDASINSPVIEAARYTATIDAKNESILQINTLWFPGWQVAINGQVREPLVTSDVGVMQIIIPTGSHKIEVKFGLTPIRAAGRNISLVSVALLLSLAIFWKRMRRFVNRQPL